MRNWPRYTKWRKQEGKRKRSERLFAFAEHLPDWNIGSLRDIKFFAQKRHEPHNRMAVHCPPGMTVSPAFLTFYDLYFTEDFSALERGLVDLLASGVRVQPVLWSPQDEITELLQTWRTRPGGGSWHRVGYMTFERCSWNPDTFRALSIDLIQISPTCINLVASAFPSDSFVDRFRKLISYDVEHTTIVHQFSILSRRWRSMNLLPSRIRQDELEELFLDLNREVVLLLRQYIGRGWAATGPLPSVHCFSYTHESDVDPNDRSHFEFWRSLNLTRIPPLHYTNGSGVDVVPPHWLDKGTFTMPYRILVNSAEYLAASRTQHYASPEIALFYNLEDEFIHPLAPLLALREHCRRAVEATSAYRDRLSPTIASKKGILATAQLIGQLMHVPPRLNSLRFSLARVTESTVQQFLDHSGAMAFRRETRGDTDDGLLSTDLRLETNFLGNHVSEQLEVLRSAYHDLWNFCIQWILIIIGVISMFIAVAQFIPKRQEPKPSTEKISAEQQNPPDEGKARC